MAIVFTTFFALGVTLINLQTGHLDIDTECILYGEIGLTPLAPKLIFMGIDLGNRSLWTIGVIFILIVLTICVFYRQLFAHQFRCNPCPVFWMARQGDSLCPHVITCPMYSCQFGSRWSYFSGGHVDLSMCHCLFFL